MTLLLKLLLAHFICDFHLQPAKWVQAKDDKQLGAWQLYAHVLLHGAVTWMLVFEWSFWKWALVVLTAHLIIDGVKLVLQNANSKRNWFFIDQSLHLVSLYAIWLWCSNRSFSFKDLLSDDGWLIATLILFLTLACSYAIKIFISKWTPSAGTNDALLSAGKYIGICERLFVFAFVVTNHWDAIGFLITAKSVFRFGELKEAKDIKLTEYVLIGTLVSFGLAMLAGGIYIALRS